MSEPTVNVTGRLAVIWIRGRDTVTFLDGLLSQSVAAIPIGGTARSLLLAPNGKLRAILFVLRGDDRVGLICDAPIAGAVAADLNRFKIRVDVAIEVDSSPVWEVWGEAPEGVIATQTGRWDTAAGGDSAFAMPFVSASLTRVVGFGTPPFAAPDEAADIEARRIELGEPVVGVDLDDKTIPQEAVPVAEYVDFTKGCYLGQELVARIDSRGHVNRRLAGLTINDAPPLSPGVEVTVDGVNRGVVTSVGFSSGLGATVALAMVRAEVEPGTTVDVAGVTATVVALPIVS